MATNRVRHTTQQRRRNRHSDRRRIRREQRRDRIHTGVPTTPPVPEIFAPPPGTPAHAAWQAHRDHWRWLQAHYTQQRKALQYRRALARQTWGLA